MSSFTLRPGTVDDLQPELSDIFPQIYPALVGGGVNLNGQTTVGITVGRAAVALYNGQSAIFDLEAGTDAQSLPDVVRPLDYAGGTNEKVWKLRLALAALLSSIIASGSAVALSTGTTANVTSLVLTPGEWDVEGVVGITGTGLTATAIQGGISATTITMGGEDARFDQPAALSVFTGLFALPTPSKRFIVANGGTQTVYLVANSIFSVGSAGAYGTLLARRVK